MGRQAGHNEAGSNRLYIENSNSSAPLIYGEFDNEIVGINGSLGVGTQSPQEEIHVLGSIRMVDGNQTDGFVPVSDANGTMVWTNPATLVDTLNLLQDADRDTKIRVEESADEDIIRFDTFGAERMVIDNNGKIGIGTNTPNATLHITADNASEGQILVNPSSLAGQDGAITIRGARNGSTNSNHAILRFENYDNDLSSSSLLGSIVGRVSNATTNIGDLIFSNSPNGSNVVETMRLTFDGNIGIGTPSPTARLGVVSAITTSTDMAQFGTSIGAPKAALSLSTNGSGEFKLRNNVNGTDVFISSDDDSYFRGGRVGIGTITPQALLDVLGDVRVNNFGVYFTDSQNANSLMQLTANDLSFPDAGLSVRAQLNPSDGDPIFRVLSQGGAERLRVEHNGYTSVTNDFSTSGKASIGNIAGTNYQLEVAGSASGSTNADFVAHIRNTNTSASNTARYNGVSILAGKNANNSANSRMIAFYRPDQTEIGRIQQNNSNSVSYNTSSDIRLKTNITETQYGLETLRQINVKDYVFKDEPTDPQTGFIAQQLFEHYPEAVSVGGEDVKTDPWMVDYGKLTPLLVKAVQDLTKLVEEQQREIEALKTGK
ncbi:MAG: tail fiber domain-containing protein [Flavobacteriales bacterium]